MKTVIVAGREVAYDTSMHLHHHVKIPFWDRVRILLGRKAITTIWLYFQKEDRTPVAHKITTSVY